MDLGLGNLITLKRHLLAASLQAGTTYNTVIADLGKGVAKQFDKHCNRLFARAASGTDEFSADRGHWITRRYPIESVSAVDIRSDIVTGWVSQTVNNVITNRDDGAGLLFFGGQLGYAQAVVRVTYTGGYFIETDEGEATAVPAGATAIPDDVTLAWKLQCREVWNKFDKLGAGISQAPDVSTVLANLKLIPQVEAMLALHRRLQIT